MNLEDILDTDLLARHVADGYVNMNDHPTEPLVIYNYSKSAQFEGVWDHVTTRCRGLIANTDGNVVARPFAKFFNFAEHGDEGRAGPLALKAPLTVFDKMDGCFEGKTALNLWDGSTKTIREIVQNRLPVTLIGMDSAGNMVPAQVTDWHHNGRKDQWLDIEISAPVSRRSGARGVPNKIRVTPNHSIHVNGKYIPAIDSRPGDTIVTQDLEPDGHAYALIRASLLGDGCVSSTRKGQARYAEGHKYIHREYVYMLADVLGTSSTKIRSRTSGYGSTMCDVSSKGYRKLQTLRNEWYPNGVKVVPDDLSWLNNQAVAKWYEDDGSLCHTEFQNDRAVFATNSFSESDVTRLGEYLRTTYSIKYAVRYEKGWVLHLNSGPANTIENFWRAIAPYIHPVFRYKLPVRWRDEPYIPWVNGKEVVVPREATILSVTPIAPTRANFGSGRTGFDVTTTTSNYLARGMLVHNSLGVSYTRPSDGRLAWATRGSFTSDQALWATGYWDTNFSEYGELLYREYGDDVTLLAEIVVPWNRIVVDYGDYEGLVLLSILENETGKHVGPWSSATVAAWPDRVVEVFSTVEDIEQLDANDRDSAEGYVVLSGDGVTRVKLKSEDYIRLHRIMTGLTDRRVWEHMVAELDLDDLLREIPEEMEDWVRGVADDLTQATDDEMLRLENKFREVEHLLDNRKDFALAIKDDPDKGALFLLADGKRIALRARTLNALKPAGKQFVQDIDA